jgi:hypothetical protein
MHGEASLQLLLLPETLHDEAFLYPEYSAGHYA